MAPLKCQQHLVLIQYELDQQARKAQQTSSLQEAIQEQVVDLSEMPPKQAMRYLTHYLEDNEPTEAATQIRQAENLSDAAHVLMEIVRVNLVAEGIEIAPERPWA